MGPRFPLRTPAACWITLLLVLLMPLRTDAGTAPRCPGDCNDDGLVVVSELIRALRIALGLAPYELCPAADANADGTVEVTEIVAAVAAALGGCPPPPGSTATATRTATPSEPVTTPPTPTASTIPSSPTRTPSVSPSASVSATTTVTLTPTASDTPTASPSATPTDTPTRTPTRTPTPRMTPPLSARVCGDGVVQRGEECDDHNAISGDGCSAICRSEAHGDRCADITPVAGTALKAVRVAAGLSQPLYATAPPGDFARVFVVEQRGRIRIVKDGQLLATPFLDLTDRVVSGGERGLLSLAFHPQYATNGEFFVDYTTQRGTSLVSVVSRFRVSPTDPDRADPTSEEILLEQDQPFVAHNGGQLLFDAEGYLYISFGDGGLSASTQNSAQDPTTWLGKILRIDVDGGVPYALPAHNPFLDPADGVLDEIWVSGLRNPWRFSIDPVTGIAYIGDVGEQAFEEVDIVPPGSGGENFGWCCREANQPFTRCFQAATTCPAEGLVDPVLVYDHMTGCSVTGGFVYRGCAMPDLNGTYFYSDYCAGFLRSFVWAGGAVTNEHDWTAEITPDAGTINRVTGFGEDARGELYICDQDGELFKLVPGE